MVTDLVPLIAPFLRVLVIGSEGSEGDRLVDGLRTRGASVEWVATDQDGLRALNQKLFDLIVCDLETPAMGAFALMQQVGRDPTIGDIPFILTHHTWDDSNWSKVNGGQSPLCHLTSPLTSADLDGIVLIASRAYLNLFWISEDNIGVANPRYPLGCGITAYSERDALAIYGRVSGVTRSTPPIRKLSATLVKQFTLFDLAKAQPSLLSRMRRGSWLPDQMAALTCASSLE